MRVNAMSYSTRKGKNDCKASKRKNQKGKQRKAPRLRKRGAIVTTYEKNPSLSLFSKYSPSNFSA